MEKLNLIGFYTLLSGEGCGSRYYPHFLLNCHLNFPHTMDHSLQHTQIVIIQSTFEKIKFPSNSQLKIPHKQAKRTKYLIRNFTKMYKTEKNFEILIKDIHINYVFGDKN